MDFSYDFQNVVRDLSDILNVVVAKQPTLISLIPQAGNNQEATNTKHEWLEDTVEPEATTLTSALDTTSTTVQVADGSIFQPEMIITIEGSDEVMKVTGVSGNTLTVVRGYGETTAESHSANSEVKIISRPAEEGSDPGDDPGKYPETEWNQTEIFDYTARVSTSAQSVKQYGIENALNYRVRQAIEKITRRMNNAIIFGRRVLRTKTERGTMGGILYFLKQPGGNVINAAGSDLTRKLLNDTIEKIYLKGGSPDLIVCNTTQARKISAFNANNITIQREDQTAGNFVARFVADLPAGVITTIVVDTNFPKDKIAILDTSRLRLVPLAGSTLTDFDATPNGADFIARRILGEYTLEVKNAKQAHGVLENLAY